MLTDRFGLPLSTSSQAARDAYVAGCDCVLSAAHGAFDHLGAAVAADPGFALAHAALARWCFLVADVAKAREEAAKARALGASATAREQSHINALCLPIDGKGADTLAAVRAHLTQYPRDAMVAALGAGVYGLIGFSGRQGRETEQLEFLEVLRPHLGDDWWFQSFYAFALGELGRLDEALPLIERSMRENPRNAHGAHVMAHVLYERGENVPAHDYLQNWLADYPRQGLMHCHLSWHLALSALILGQPERAWQIYQAQVHPGGAWGPPLNIATDAPSFLWRAELAGQPRRSELWQQVHAYVGKSFPKAGIGLVDVHRALGAVAADNAPAIDQLVDELSAIVARSPCGEVVPALARGLVAYGRGDWPAAIAALQPALAQTVRIGGSRAQRDLVRGTLLAAYLRGGQPEQARQLIAAQTDRRPAIPLAV